MASQLDTEQDRQWNLKSDEYTVMDFDNNLSPVGPSFTKCAVM